MKGLREFAERQTEAVQESQREQLATLTPLNTAVELTGAALRQLTVEGSPDEQAVAPHGMRVLFPEAVALCFGRAPGLHAGEVPLP